MSFCWPRFNLYLLAAVALLLVCGCSTFHKKKKDEPLGIVRVHVESESNAVGPNKTINVPRSQPVEITILTDPVLTEEDVVSARLLDAPGGYAIQIRFEESAAWRLEQYTAINPGKHLAIFAQWSEKPEDGRWLAAPLISRRIGGGVLTFTADATHEEAEKWVAGLNLMAKKNNNGQLKEMKD